MDNVTFLEVEGVEHAIIDRGNGEFTSMTKAEYDRREAEQSTPNLAGQVVSSAYGTYTLRADSRAASQQIPDKWVL